MADPVVWFEVTGHDPEGTAKFYGELFGWKVHRSEGGDFVYGEIHDEGGHGISGGIGGTPDRQPHVNLYADVDDVQKYLEKAESLGGSTIMPPMDVGDTTTIAQFHDPQGTWFGLYRRSET
jgi:predicted enzyme related to lactoylglutathione lyase